MNPPLDVFVLDSSAEPIWLGAASDFEDAKRIIQNREIDGHFRYMINSQLTGNRVFYEVIQGQPILTKVLPTSY